MPFDSKLFQEKTAEYNTAMVNAARRGGRTLKNQLNEMGARKTDDLVNYVGYATRKRNGEIYNLRWKTYRYGLIIEHGSGRGWAKGVQTHSNTSTNARKPKPWISTGMRTIMTDVADVAARLKGDDMIAATDKQMELIYGRANYRIG